jgi:phosphate:Na+ symporter
MELALFLLNLAGAVFLLLYSSRMVRTGVERAMGANLRNIFMTTRRSITLNALAGSMSAAMLQSSTAVLLLVSGFTASGVMGVTGSLAVVLGADLGTAIAVKFLSLDLTWLIPLLLVAGGVLFLKLEARLARQAGRVLFGIAFILISLRMIGEATEPLRGSSGLVMVVDYLASDPVTAFIGGAAITFAFHSSVASVLMFATFCAQGVLPLEAGLPLVLGANAGGGLIGAWLTRNLEIKARRVAIGNLLIRALSAVAVLLLLMEFTLPWDLPGDTTARQLVMFHLLFNSVLVAIWLPLVVPLAKLTKLLLPDPTASAMALSRRTPVLDRKVLNSPGLALASVTRELLHMGEQVEAMLSPVMNGFICGSTVPTARIAEMEQEVNETQNSIKLYLAEMNQGELTPEQAERSMELASVAIGLERIGGIIAKDLMRLARQTRDNQLSFSKEGWAELTAMHARVLANMQLSLNVLLSDDLDSATQLVKEKETFRRMEQESHDRHLARLAQSTPQSIATSNIHLDILRALKEINSRLVYLAYPLLKRHGMLRESRLDVPS